MMLLKLLSASNGDWNSLVVSLGDEGTIGPRIAQLGIPVHALGLRPPLLNPARMLSAVSRVRRFRPHLIQGWMYYGNLMANFLDASSTSRVPVLWNIRMSLYDIEGEPLLNRTAVRLGAFLSRRPAAIIYNSRTAAKQHEDFGYAAKQFVIPNGFDCRTFRPDEETRRRVRTALGIGNDDLLIGLIARFHPMKDHALFLRAAGIVARTSPKMRFLLAGSGVTTQEPFLQTLIADNELQDRVLLLGERADIPQLTAALDIACSTSAWGEGFSNSIGEAMACGIPCIVTDIGDSAYIVADTGISIPKGDVDALVAALRQLVDAGESQRRKLGAAARRRVETEFALPAITGRYGDLYQKCLAGLQGDSH